ncbi:DVU0772 family protein [Desulforamulus hydrothermalis]|uniref:Uncharacterized protein n=1 Tax=Desulforamulus hydrothermalis Lam5 = DSM 18033 TaxID=1121428 RepID=K8DX32_9FIRM|nr:hypothetical protein [Desulforamulus hydrothermalis]CCO07102.1 conserved hypothetical protein [Desulforamulus hydrothermalis Lam5 = DSM 18033]SHG90128.1 hypothetical protein SAMN02745177_00772 [Desulforamulus hydrothermalis Lam5 = DSM 18033]
MTLPIIKALIDWDYDFSQEFQNREKGYTFVIDAWESPKLALYKFTPFGIKCDHTDLQPPAEMLEAAIRGQEANRERIYKINQELRTWIEEHILSD